MADNKTAIKGFLLAIGDIAVLYASLFITLLIRYGNNFYDRFLDSHSIPFAIIFIFILLIFYIAELYDFRKLRNNIDFIKTLAVAITSSAVIAILLFYFIPVFGIAPKTNLFIFFILFAVIEFLWRRFFNKITTSTEMPNKVLFIGEGSEIEEVSKVIKENPQLGYSINASLKEEDIINNKNILKETSAKQNINIIVVPRHIKRQNEFAEALYELFREGISIVDVADFYELILQKIPLDDLEEAWFFENIERASRFYDPLKNAGEFIFAIVLGMVLLPIEILIAIIIKLTSKGPIFIKQKRVGKLGEIFTLYKFRSMVAMAPDGQAETNGAQWSTKNDSRITPFGKIIRATHLDELPQLLNVAQGKLSFVGPRPERPEFVEILKEKIPYYEIRLLVKPGVTGWAQINHRADLSLDDVKQKLQYDVYYLKNRSMIIDIAIILKTIKSVFINPKE
jgi:exopolysaccharide biosynthesis polyprenyl glycosylphosphotransferase